MTDLLEVDRVSVTFGGLRALDEVSIRVPKGAVIGLIGPNGAGKSTLFNVISGLQAPASGHVRFRDQDVTRLSPGRRAGLGMGRNFQNLALMSGETVLTNLLAAQHLGCGYRGGDVFRRPWRWRAGERRLHARAVEAAAALGVAGHLERPVADLSFAAARFVELACVLVERPRLMLLDVPTTGV
jgi:branched-chain amino acid transport system ATP-binding protein